MTAAQRTAISGAATRLLVYQTDGIAGFYFFDGSVWASLSGSGSGSSPWTTSGNNISNSNTGNVGIGTTSPAALLHVADSAVAFSATGDVPATPTAPPISGAGRRMMWYPQKAAFRAGYVIGNDWDKDSTGMYSTAFGKACRASGRYSFASGDSSFAKGLGSVAMGGGDHTWGWNDVNGNYSVGIGYANFVNGNYSAAVGSYNLSTGVGAYSFGMDAVASVDSSMALGYNCYTLHKGACMITDENGNWNGAVLYSSAKNQMTMRFTGGYRLFTNWTGATSNVGVQLPAGGNSWATISDRNRKTNFEPIDGESVLNKLNKWEMTTWNYKDQEPETFRHYGPMAQDFYAAFGHDKYGTIGSDSLICQSDLEGVSLVAIQALIKRTDEKTKQINALQTENALLQSQITTVTSTQGDLLKKLDLLTARLNAIEAKMTVKQ